MAFDTVSISSDDDVPLKAIGASLEPITSTSLKERSLQHCDFCEEVFLNKYDALIHNAKHIIIPLIKRELHQCPLCLFYFTSRYKLKHHTRNKHKNDIITNNENVTAKNDAKETNEKNVKLDNDKKHSEKNVVIIKNDFTKGSNKNHVKLGDDNKNNEKSKDLKVKMVTKYESDDDDDLPLVNGNLKAQATKETEKAKCQTDILREALLKDVKVVLEKIELMPESKLSVKVPKNFELNAKEPEKTELKPIIKMPDQIENAKNSSERFKPKLIIVKMPDKLKNANTNNAEKIKPEVDSVKPEIEMKAKISIIAEPTVAIMPESKAKISTIVYPKVAIMPESKVKINTIVDPKVAIMAESKAKLNTIVDPKVAIMPESKAKINTIAEPKEKISSRLRFEDDIDDFDDAVMKDLTTDCIVDMNLFDEPWFDELANSIPDDEVVDDDMIITIDDDDETEDNREKEDDTVYSASTHHDELVKPGVYRCRKCQQMFPTRFNQIQHEMSHMHIRKPRPFLCEHCDRFIANKKALKDHINTKHHTNYRPRTYQACTKCGLRYNNYDRHLENYHIILRCHLCNKGFESDIDRLNHIRGHLVKIKCGQCGFVASELEIQEHKRRFHKSFVNLVEFNLCDVCCLFLRNKHNTNYVFGETVSKLGARLDCEHCGNKFFHVTQVRRTVKGRPTDRFTFEKERERKKGLTNTERLKNIQQRLKMINKLSRFNQIQHEMSHMHIRKPRPFLCEHCDRFIANKKALKDHINTKHHTNYRPRTYQACTKCGLRYNNYDRHLENYHIILRCHLCNKGFESDIDRLNHIRGHLVKIKCGQCGFVASELEIQEHKRRFHKSFVNLVEFNLCDVCCLFLRNKHNTNYVFGETVSKLGARLDCEHCGNKFFHVTQVRRTVKGRPTDRFTFEKERERKKGLTNTERLKNIQQRLKMINKLSRF